MSELVWLLCLKLILTSTCTLYMEQSSYQFYGVEYEFDCSNEDTYGASKLSGCWEEIRSLGACDIFIKLIKHEIKYLCPKFNS